jgi:polyisoprenyl-phosphate glycosyltransferase
MNKRFHDPNPPVVSGQDLDLSIVIPVYRNRETLEELCERIQRTLGSEQYRFEIIFIDDNCPEGSFSLLKKISARNSSVRALAFIRNQGQHRAIFMGLKYSRGKQVVVLDADLQDPPEAIPLLLKKLQEGHPAVFAGRRGWYESFFRLLTSKIFKYLLYLLCGVPSDAGIFVALDRKVVDSLLNCKTSSPFVVAMIGCAGFPMTSIPIRRSIRSHGRSSYSFWKRLKSALNAIAFIIGQKWFLKRSSSDFLSQEDLIREKTGFRDLKTA